jgi:hypothetical protein
MYIFIHFFFSLLLLFKDELHDEERHDGDKDLPENDHKRANTCQDRKKKKKKMKKWDHECISIGKLANRVTW